MKGLPELPPKFQCAFRAAKDKAELAFHKRAENFPNLPQFADMALHLPILVQRVFLAFCEQALNACREGHWTAAYASHSIEEAWAPICDFYSGRECGGSDEWRANYRVALWHGIADTAYTQHLAELAALAEEEALNTSAMPARKPVIELDTRPNRENTKKRLSGTIASPLAARRMEAFMEPIGQTELAKRAQTTDRTLRKFRKTGKLRRDIFGNVAEAMGTTPEALLKPE